MRSQRRAPATVTLVRSTRVTDTDDLGDAPASPVAPERIEIAGAMFEPQQILTRSGNDQVPVVRPAVWNLPGVYDVDADDLIEHEGTTWQVTGGGNVWLDRTKVPVTETRRV